MNCKNCEYGLKQRCGDFEKIICTYEEGECVKITELKAQVEQLVYLHEEDVNTIKLLNKRIEKMKCCEMCKHKNIDWGFRPICEARDKIKIENPLTCKCDKWEIKEND